MTLDDETRAFLAELHAGGAHGYWWTVDGDRKTSYWWATDAIPSLPRAPVNTYFGVHSTTEIPTTNAAGKAVKPQWARSRTDLIAAINCLFAEYDAKDFGGDLDATLNAVQSLRPQPSVIVASGGGYHAYWLLTRTWQLTTSDEREQARQIQWAWVRRMGGDGAAKDLARVLRVPGSKNYKYQPPRDVAFVAYDLKRRYELSALVELIEPEWARRKLDAAVATIRQAPNGQKHDTLLKMARLGGGVSDILGEQTVAHELYAAIEDRADDPRNAAKTIMDGMRYGSMQPLSIATVQARPVNGTDPHYEFCTDLGNAHRLIAQHGADIRFVQEWGWLVWDGLCWAIDQTGGIERRAKATVMNIYQEAADAPEHLRERLAKHAISSQSAARIAAMIKLAESELAVRCVASDFDTHDWLIACSNGLLDLKTGVLGPPRRDVLLTRAIPVAYDPNAKCPMFLDFLDRIFDGNDTLIAYIQRVVGYVLTGSTGGQCMFVLYGSGANGKSVLLNTLRAMLGDYARNAAPETFLQQQQERIRSDLARLAGCRLVSTVELDEGRRLSEALVKQVTGGDVITARFLNKNEFEFTPRFKVLMATNHKPIIRGTDYAIWRRIRLIPFAVTIPEAERDPQLTEKISAELPGILTWALDGCMDWQTSGLQEPSEVDAATNAYRSEMDVIGLFLDDCCVFSPHMRTLCAALYTAYTRWCEESGERPVSQRRFGAQVSERGIDRLRTGTPQAWNYIGVGLVTRE